MKPILIQKPCIPFYLEPGKKLLVPGTYFYLVGYPTKLEVYYDKSLTGNSLEKIQEVFIHAEYPVNDFMVAQDLERGFIRLRATAKNGFFSLKVFGDTFHLFCEIERCPEIGLKLNDSLRIRKEKILIHSLSDEALQIVDSEEEVESAEKIEVSGVAASNKAVAFEGVAETNDSVDSESVAEVKAIIGTTSLNEQVQSSKKLQNLDGLEPMIVNLFERNLRKSKQLERLSFGVHKAQNLQRVKERKDLEELLAIFYKTSLWLPDDLDQGDLEVDLDDLGFVDLLAHDIVLEDDGLDEFWANHIKQLSLCIDKKDKEFSEKLLLALISEAFLNEKHIGLPECSDPHLLFSKAAKLIKKMLISFSPNKDNLVEILPCLLIPLHAGRFTNIALKESVHIDLEWSKKKIKRVVCRVSKPQELRFLFGSDVSSFRRYKVKTKSSKNKNSSLPSISSMKVSKQKYQLIKNGNKLSFEEGVYILDNMQ